MESSNDPDRSRIAARGLVPKEGRSEYLRPTYGSFKGMLIVGLVLVAIIVGLIVVFS